METALEVDLAKAEEVITRMLPVRQSDLIPLLQKVQGIYGYLPKAVLKRVAEETDIPMSSMVGVATFYEQFSLVPQGRHIVRSCRGTACHVRGAGGIADAIGRRLHVKEGQTTGDAEFSFHTVACLGTCFLAPTMVVDKTYYGKLTPEKVGPILNQYGSTPEGGGAAT